MWRMRVLGRPQKDRAGKRAMHNATSAVDKDRFAVRQKSVGKRGTRLRWGKEKRIAEMWEEERTIGVGHLTTEGLPGEQLPILGNEQNGKEDGIS